MLEDTDVEELEKHGLKRVQTRILQRLLARLKVPCDGFRMCLCERGAAVP